MNNLGNLAKDNGEAFSITSDNNYESHNRKHPERSINQEAKQWEMIGIQKGRWQLTHMERGGHGILAGL